MTVEIKIFETAGKLAETVAERWREGALRASRTGHFFNIVLVGGGTPREVYRYLARSGDRQSIPWDAVHLFWGDERCVPPDHEESNYRMVREALIDPLSLPPENIHPFHGEDDPGTEAIRYSREIRDHLGLSAREIPRFDWILLGLGQDGHTASLFPGKEIPWSDSGICAVTTHPGSGLKRLTLTPAVLNHASRVTFIVTGSGKAQIVSEILNGQNPNQHYPAARVKPETGVLEWFLDREAAALLKQ
ncbi:MAG: 6-phosphogluconolactonase [Nitrospinaceae bacterium]